MGGGRKTEKCSLSAADGSALNLTHSLLQGLKNLS